MNTTPAVPTQANVLPQDIVPVAQTPSAPVALTTESLKHFDEQTQAAILKLADQIDPLQIDKIMAYGSVPLLRSFEFAGKILKSVEGTSVDQEVVKEVVELSKLANKNQKDLNVAIEEPGLIQKLLMNIFSSIREKKEADTKFKAVTCYRLLTQLRASCETWHQLLRDNYTLISQAMEDTMINGLELEQYIVAGRIAEARIEGELEQRKLLCETSGLIIDKAEYEASKEGFEAFKLVLLNLEKSRAAYGINMGQLRMERDTNKKLQMAVITQKNNSMALAGQQIMTAVLNAQNRQILEGQKSITALNDELFKKVSSGVALTAEESEKLLLNGIYSIEAGLAAAKTVVDGCNAIVKANADREANISQELSKLQVLVDELTPFISSMREDAEVKQSQTGSNAAASNGNMTF